MMIKRILIIIIKTFYSIYTKNTSITYFTKNRFKDDNTIIFTKNVNTSKA